ncbi:hypothetical protein [Dehalogenimonas alkenigignens]|uniref:Uncharacterized protein n=1 Tax=Dehalogenimonas alkenigignens TaxID=1217799 RepID=A0A0W0GJQ7_9CHLR|nr:hypothetical protein [Dehalogenimonas alkenigignens]KTB48782.1 hypothetical protein DEALK_16290 [Dehalogenimonas alkenigignens]PVV84806.1 hypothetical protein DD509_00385 [Dehalogenimonas alkenigignens]
MLQGKCPNCGYECVGWGLQFPRHQSCARCGTGLQITRDGKPLGTGYSPFTAEKESVPGPSTTPTKESRI